MLRNQGSASAGMGVRFAPEYAVKGYLEVNMDGYKSLTHSRYDGKYHVVFVPKGRKKTLFGKIRKYLKGVFHELARQKG